MCSHRLPYLHGHAGSENWNVLSRSRAAADGIKFTVDASMLKDSFEIPAPAWMNVSLRMKHVPENDNNLINKKALALQFIMWARCLMGHSLIQAVTGVHLSSLSLAKDKSLKDGMKVLRQ
nr:hypothetical protein Iba_chr14dCG10020 [Ipomoea batatas]